MLKLTMNLRDVIRSYLLLRKRNKGKSFIELVIDSYNVADLVKEQSVTHFLKLFLKSCVLLILSFFFLRFFAFVFILGVFIVGVGVFIRAHELLKVLWAENDIRLFFARRVVNSCACATRVIVAILFKRDIDVLAFATVLVLIFVESCLEFEFILQATRHLTDSLQKHVFEWFDARCPAVCLTDNVNEECLVNGPGIIVITVSKSHLDRFVS